MACPTCDHTMQGVRHHVYWCPRCGTLKIENTHSGHHDVQSPKVVDRARQVVQYFDSESDAHHLARAQSSGLLEAIELPHNRVKSPG